MSCIATPFEIKLHELHVFVHRRHGVLYVALQRVTACILFPLGDLILASCTCAICFKGFNMLGEVVDSIILYRSFFRLLNPCKSGLSYLCLP